MLGCWRVVVVSEHISVAVEFLEGAGPTGLLPFLM